MVTSDVDESARLEPSTSQDKTQDKDESWKKMFDPVTDQQQVGKNLKMLSFLSPSVNCNIAVKYHSLKTNTRYNRLVLKF